MSAGFACDDCDDQYIFVDFGDDPLEQPPALPDGLYHVSVVAATPAISAGGNRMVVLTLTVTAGDYAGRRLWEHLVQLPQCEWRCREVLAALTGGRLTGAQTLPLSSLVGLTATVRVIGAAHGGSTNDISHWAPFDLRV